MLRYQLLLQRETAKDNPNRLSLRDLARKAGVPIPTIHTYITDGVLPRVENMGKLADYFGESISSLYSEDDDTTARLVAAVRALPAARKKALLAQLKTTTTKRPADTSANTSNTKQPPG